MENRINYFKYDAKKELKYDLVILDPPSFAKSKKFQFSAAHDYKDLLKEAIIISVLGGVIGIFVGEVGSLAVLNMTGTKLYVDWGVIFGILPANKASKLQPIQALKAD